MRDLARLIMRLVSGGLMMGHGAQKLFGWFGGNGLEGTAQWVKSMGLRPSKPWAIAAGVSEFGGGLLTTLGLLNPLGSLGIIGSMSMATAKVHWGKPIWVTSGGAEYPLTNLAIALALGMVGPGKLSMDNLLGIKLPRRLVLIPGLALTAAAVGAGAYISSQNQKAQQAQAEQPKQQEQPARPVAAQPQGSEQQSGEQAQEQSQQQAPSAQEYTR